jgi:hypothetical protein
MVDERKPVRGRNGDSSSAVTSIKTETSSEWNETDLLRSINPLDSQTSPLTFRFTLTTVQ